MEGTVGRLGGRATDGVRSTAEPWRRPADQDTGGELMSDGVVCIHDEYMPPGCYWSDREAGRPGARVVDILVR